MDLTGRIVEGQGGLHWTYITNFSTANLKTKFKYYFVIFHTYQSSLATISLLILTRLTRLDTLSVLPLLQFLLSNKKALSALIG